MCCAALGVFSSSVGGYPIPPSYPCLKWPLEPRAGGPAVPSRLVWSAQVQARVHPGRSPSLAGPLWRALGRRILAPTGRPSDVGSRETRRRAANAALPAPDAARPPAAPRRYSVGGGGDRVQSEEQTDAKTLMMSVAMSDKNGRNMMLCGAKNQDVSVGKMFKFCHRPFVVIAMSSVVPLR